MNEPITPLIFVLLQFLVSVFAASYFKDKIEECQEILRKKERRI
jgi:hypothetical protein